MRRQRKRRRVRTKMGNEEIKQWWILNGCPSVTDDMENPLLNSQKETNE